MPMKSRRRGRGISLLELLFTIALLTIVLVVFAAVYPSGYKLNRKSARANVAMTTAAAVAAELQGLPILANELQLDKPSLQRLATDPAGVTTFIQTQMRTKIPEGFRLNNTGIVVSVAPKVEDKSNLPLIAFIRVTINWTDVNDLSLQRQVTASAVKTDNLVGR